MFCSGISPIKRNFSGWDSFPDLGDEVESILSQPDRIARQRQMNIKILTIRLLWNPHPVSTASPHNFSIASGALLNKVFPPLKDQKGGRIFIIVALGPSLGKNRAASRTRPSKS
jgi:hypothetical protein